MDRIQPRLQKKEKTSMARTRTTTKKIRGGKQIMTGKCERCNKKNVSYKKYRCSQCAMLVCADCVTFVDDNFVCRTCQM